MAVIERHTLPLRTAEDILFVRQTVRASAIELGFSLVDQTKIVTAASELARNTVDHGGGGEMRMEVINEANRCGLRIAFEDKGPGIPDIGLAMTDGYSTSGGLGLGLGGARRLSNEFEIFSRPGEGTKVSIIKWKSER